MFSIVTSIDFRFHSRVSCCDRKNLELNNWLYRICVEPTSPNIHESKKVNAFPLTFLTTVFSSSVYKWKYQLEGKGSLEVFKIVSKLKLEHDPAFELRKFIKRLQHRRLTLEDSFLFVLICSEVNLSQKEG